MEWEHFLVGCLLLGGKTQYKSGFLVESGLPTSAGGTEQGDCSGNFAIKIKLKFVLEVTHTGH